MLCGTTKPMKKWVDVRMKDKNIVVILCDQLRKTFLSIYGGEMIKTPNIDRLASLGVVFDEAITQSPVCAPARATMMTGRYVSDHGVWSNDVPFREGIEYLPERMNQLGYHTCAFGKLHHFPGKDVKGFQYAKQMEENRLGEVDDYFQFLKAHHPEVTGVFNHKDGFIYDEAEYYEAWIASCAVQHIHEHKGSKPNQPFMAWISFQGPHTPYDPPQSVRGTVDVSKLPDFVPPPDEDISSVVSYRRILGGPNDWQEHIAQDRIKYAEMIVEIDCQIGKVITELEELGIFEETIFIFSADHGDLLCDYNGIDAKGPFPYSQQLNIPLILANHPEVPHGQRSDALVGNIDIAATVLEIAGDKKSLGVSCSLIEQIKSTPSYTRKVNYSEFCDSMKLVENKKYRFCYYPFTADTALFDKITDKQERYNLSGKPEYAQIEQSFLRDIIDFSIISKGVHIEAHDFVPAQQEGLKAKNPHFLESFDIAFPIPNKGKIEALRTAGLSTTYNEFCKTKEVKASYGCYWEES